MADDVGEEVGWCERETGGRQPHSKAIYAEA